MVRIHPDPPLFLRWLALVDEGANLHPWVERQIAVSVHDWGISSAGRAPALQAGGRRFDPVILHQSSMRRVLRKQAEPCALAIEPVRVICGYGNRNIGCRSLTIRKK